MIFYYNLSHFISIWFISEQCSMFNTLFRTEAFDWSICISMWKKAREKKSMTKYKSKTQPAKNYLPLEKKSLLLIYGVHLDLCFSFPPLINAHKKIVYGRRKKSAVMYVFDPNGNSRKFISRKTATNWNVSLPIFFFHFSLHFSFFLLVCFFFSPNFHEIIFQRLSVDF